MIFEKKIYKIFINHIYKINFFKISPKDQWRKYPRVRITKTKPKITGVAVNVEKLQPLCIAGGNVKWCSCCGKHLSVPREVKHRAAISPSNSTPR